MSVQATDLSDEGTSGSAEQCLYDMIILEYFKVLQDNEGCFEMPLRMQLIVVRYSRMV